MKKIVSMLLALLLISSTFSQFAYAIEDVKKAPAAKQAVNAPKVEIALVFDSDSEKSKEIVKTYKPIIEKSMLPDYQAVFADDLVFKGDWSEEGAEAAAEKALKSRAKMVVSFGYLASEYLSSKKNKTKNVVTVDQYAIRALSDKFFNPVQQSVNDFVVFQRLVPNMGKTAILINERVYNSRNDWDKLAKKGLEEKGCNIDFVILPLSNNIEESLASLPEDIGSVYVTQIYNLNTEERRALYSYLNAKKLPTFSSMGKEDVELGALFGTSTPDLDKKLAETLSFNIKNVLKGGAVKTTPVNFVNNNSLYFNKDTAMELGYNPHLRLLRTTVEVVTTAKAPVRDFGYVLKTFDERNLTVQRKQYLVSAARRSLASAYTNYLPTVRIDLGYQTYNSDYARSYDDVPTKAGVATFGIDQMLYAPDLVTNIIVKHKKLRFDKAEKVLTEQNLGLQIAHLYIDFLMLKNVVNIQKEYLDEVNNNLAIAKNRQMAGKCGMEEVLRWTGEYSKAERDLFMMQADFSNLKSHMNQILYTNQGEDFDLAPLSVTDPAFFLSEINIIDHINKPDKMKKFLEMLIEEAIYLSPETTKLKAAIAMKKAEMANYAQKFILPNAKLTWETSQQITRELPYYDYLVGNYFNPANGSNAGMRQLRQMHGYGNNALDRDSQRLMIAAQWKPFEGGKKIAEIARCKAELNELKTYLEQVNTEIEYNIRSVVNRAISKYVSIERAYKAKFAQGENYKITKQKYLMGKVDIAQTADSLVQEHHAKIMAANAHNEFFKELVWLQRGLASVNWLNASDEAKSFIQRLKDELATDADVNVNI